MFLSGLCIVKQDRRVETATRRSCTVFLLDLGYLLPLEDVLAVDDPVGVVVTKEPVLELAPLSDGFQKVRELIRLVAWVYLP